jgi:hypothetical protein
MIDREAHDHEIPGSSDRAFGWTMSAVFAVDHVLGLHAVQPECRGTIRLVATDGRFR